MKNVLLTIILVCVFAIFLGIGYWAGLQHRQPIRLDVETKFDCSDFLENGDHGYIPISDCEVCSNHTIPMSAEEKKEWMQKMLFESVGDKYELKRIATVL